MEDLIFRLLYSIVDEYSVGASEVLAGLENLSTFPYFYLHHLHHFTISPFHIFTIFQGPIFGRSNFEPIIIHFLSIRDCLSLLLLILDLVRALPALVAQLKDQASKDVCRSLLHSPLPGQSSSRRYAQANPMILS